MHAEEAREITENCEASYIEALNAAFKKIEEQASMGFSEAWVVYPASEKQIKRFLEELSGVYKYKVNNRSGNSHHVQW